jgi:hypothetical protein
MNWNLDRKSQVLPSIWQALSDACRHFNHPLRTPVVGTGMASSPHSPAACRLRTVILREVLKQKRSLIFHTDIRSPKCQDIQANPLVQWLWYDPAEKIQIKAMALARIHHLDQIARRAWRQTPLPSRVNYSTPGTPGTPITRPAKAWTENASPQNMTVPGSEKGWPHFAVVATKVIELEFLKLSSEGHRRLHFSWAQNRLTSTWLVP